MGDAEVFSCRGTKVVTCLSYAKQLGTGRRAAEHTGRHGRSRLSEPRQHFVHGARILGLVVSGPSGAQIFDCAVLGRCRRTCAESLNRRSRWSATASTPPVMHALNVPGRVATQLSAVDFDSRGDERLTQSRACYARPV